MLNLHSRTILNAKCTFGTLYSRLWRAKRVLTWTLPLPSPPPATCTSQRATVALRWEKVTFWIAVERCSESATKCLILRYTFEASKLWWFHGFGPVIKKKLDEVHSRKTPVNTSAGTLNCAILKGYIRKECFASEGSFIPRITKLTSCLLGAVILTSKSQSPRLLHGHESGINVRVRPHVFKS